MKILFLGTLLSLLAACGGPSSGNKTPQENVIFTSYSNEPLFLKKQNTECRSKSFEKDITYSLYFHLEEIDTFEIVNIANLVTQLAVKDNETISRTLYGEKVERITSARGTRIVPYASPTEVTLCPDEDHYDQETVESASINAAYVIKKTRDSFKKAVKDIVITPVTVNISPAVIESTIRTNEYGENVKESSYWTDNALYNPESKSITFLPHSQEMKNNGMTVNFWEVPMIASHEYGHHLFQSIYKAKTKAALSIGCFDHVKPKPSKINNKSYGFRLITIEDVLTSMNEGFADLISYYTLGASERGIKGIMCLEVTRDVGSTTMINGKSKVLTSSVIDTFFSWSEEMSSCDQPSYQEVHVMGAVLAHSMDRFMSTFTSSEQEKLKNLVEWVKYLNTNQDRLQDLDAKLFLTEAMQSFVQMSLRQFKRTADGTTCKSIRSIFPGINYQDCYGK